MDDTSFKLLAKYLPSTYVQQAKDARNSQNFLINQLLEKVNRKKYFSFEKFYFCYNLEEMARRRME
jgi:hypothetical protein